MQKKQNHTQTVLICLGLLLTGFVLTSMIPTKSKNNPKPQQTTADTERNTLQKTLQQYLQFLSPTGDWWMVKTPPPTAETARDLSVTLSNVSKALASARSVSPLTEEIAQNFNQFFTSVFENGVSRVTMTEDIDVETLRGKTEVCFFSKNEGHREKVGGLLYFRQDWRAIMIAGVQWSSPHFEGLLYHELYHALQHRKGESSLSGSERWVREEVDAHELEMVVFDYLTQGKYFRETESVLLDHSGIQNERTLLGSVGTNAFFRLDKVLGLENKGADIRGTSVAQHVLSLGFRFIDKRGGTKEDKVALYRWIRKG